MTADTWDQAKRLFLSAADLPPAQVSRFLDEACGGDGELRAEVESLLAADRKNGAGIAAAVETEAALLLDSPRPGERLGPYRIEREIGRGGMGAVFLATRDDEQYRKRVAIKVVKRGMDTDEVLARFRYERQILADLDHPYIAGLYDGGTTPDGRPYFVMEFVEGQPVDVFCREHHLGAEVLCRLFLRICEAVAYAHRNLVVHRDLKPINIFITPDGTPKLLDFGIAKLLDERAVGMTAPQTRYFTPEYASPEQALGLHVTTASDVYSLGLIFRQLLEFANPKLDSDLDNITLMATRREPERRYQSVAAFADDIRRHLEARPVLARKDSLWYRTKKFVKRERYAVAAAAVLLIILVAGIVITSSAARQARAEQAKAEERLAEIVTLSNYSLSGIYSQLERLPDGLQARKEMLGTMLGFLKNISKGAGNDERLKLALAKAYLRLGDLEGDPDVPNIGDVEGAAASYRSAEALLGAASSMTGAQDRLDVWAEVQDKLSKTLTEKGDRAQSRKVLNDAIRVVEQIRGSHPRSRALLYLTLSRVTFDLNEALRLALISLNDANIAAAQFPDDDGVQVILSTSNTQVGFVYLLMGKPENAEQPYSESVRIRERMYLAHPDDVVLRRNLKLAYEHYAGMQGSPLVVKSLGHPEISREYYKKAQPLEEADYADPQNHLAKFDYANFLYRSAAVETSPETVAGSLVKLEKAAAIFESLRAAQPQTIRYGQACADVYIFIGDRLCAMHDYPKALAEYQRAASLGNGMLAQDPESEPVLSILARSKTGVTRARTYMGKN